MNAGRSRGSGIDVGADVGVLLLGRGRGCVGRLGGVGGFGRLGGVSAVRGRTVLGVGRIGHPAVRT